MEFLVEFAVEVPEGTSREQVDERTRGEAVAAAELVAAGNLLRVWTRSDDKKIIGLYRAQSRDELDGLLRGLPLFEWMDIAVTAFEAHPNDPAATAVNEAGPGTGGLPAPRLRFVYRLEVGLGEPLDVGDVAGGRRRIVPQTGGAFTGPELNGTLLAGASADWQLVLADGTALGDSRYTLKTDDGDLLYVTSSGVRHGSPDVLARLARGEDVDPAQYTFRTSTRIEAAAAHLDWLSKGVFISVGARQPAGVVYETYLVG
jgi:muconolactone delta-isomerase